MRHFLLSAAALLMLFPGSASADITIKMATLAPEGTSWYKNLRKMGDEWAKISNGEVKLKIYAGGVVGNETVMLRKMRIGQLHSAAVTNLGLLEIDPSAQVVSTPMLIQTYDELDYVMEKLTPEIERRIEANGFVVLSWGDAGWVHLFSKEALTDPADVGKLKIFAWEGDPGAVEMYRKGGFKPVVIPATDVLPSLQSGLIDSFPNTPLACLAMQWFGLAQNMLDVPWAPLIGAIIVKKDVWESIPEKYRADIRRASRAKGLETQHLVRTQDRKAVEVMKQYGLTVNSVDAETYKKWEALAHSLHPIVREKIVSPEIFDLAVKHLNEFRSQQK